MAKKRHERYALSRRGRAVWTGIALVTMALLAVLDRTWSPYRPTGTTAARLPAATEDFSRYHGRRFGVVNVLDGDTLEIDAPDSGAPATRVRLLGIDAPEMGFADRQPMHYATEATAGAKQLAGGCDVTIYLQDQGPYRGKYGRLLAYIELPDGTFLNETLVAEGCAYADLRFRHGYYQKYQQLEASARALSQGLWAEATRDDLPPWLQRMRPRLLAKD